MSSDEKYKSPEQRISFFEIAVSLLLALLLAVLFYSNLRQLIARRTFFALKADFDGIEAALKRDLNNLDSPQLYIYSNVSGPVDLFKPLQNVEVPENGKLKYLFKRFVPPGDRRPPRYLAGFEIGSRDAEASYRYTFIKSGIVSIEVKQAIKNTGMKF